MAKQQQITKIKQLIESSLVKLEKMNVSIEDYLWDLKIKFANDVNINTNNNDIDEKKDDSNHKKPLPKISLLADIKQNNMCDRGHTMIDYDNEKCNKCCNKSKYLCLSCKYYEKQYYANIYDKTNNKYCWCNFCSLANGVRIKKGMDRNIKIQKQIIKYNNNNPELSIDLLCGLPNKIALEYLLTEIAVIDQNSDVYCVYVFDIDDFKKLNKECGHHKADKKLQQISQILKKYANKSEIYWRNQKISILRIWPFRQGGDEFAMIIKGRDRQIHTQSVFYELLKNEINNIGINISVGMYCYGSDGKKKETFDIWLEKADAALYESKKTGKNAITINIGAFDKGIIGGFENLHEHILFNDEFDY